MHRDIDPTRGYGGLHLAYKDVLAAHFPDWCISPAVPSGRDGNELHLRTGVGRLQQRRDVVNLQARQRAPPGRETRRTYASRPNRSRKAWARASPWAVPAAAFKLTVGS